MSRLSGQHIPRATVRGAINSLPRPEGDNLFRLDRSSPAPGRMTIALRQGPVRVGEKKPPAWPRPHRVGPPRGAMVTASICTSQGCGRQPSALSLLQWDISLLLPKLCTREADAIAAGRLWTAPPGLVPTWDHTQPYSCIPTKGPVLLVLQEKEPFENLKFLQLIPGNPCFPRYCFFVVLHHREGTGEVPNSQRKPIT